MQRRAEPFTQAKPHVMDQIDICGPQARWMRSEVDENRRTVRGNDFERKRMARFGEVFPSLANASGELFGSHARGNAGNQTRSLEVCSRLNKSIKWVYARHDEQF